MRFLLVALLCAISYAQTDFEEAVGTAGGTYVHCSDKLLDILKSGAFKSTDKSLKKLGITVEQARDMPNLRDKLVTLFIKVGAQGNAGTLVHAVSRLKDESGDDKISGCFVFSDPNNLIEDHADDSYPSAFGIEIPFSAAGADGQSIALDGAYFHEACADPNGDGKAAPECVTSKAFRKLMGNYTPTKMNWDQENRPGLQSPFTQNAIDYITETWPAPTRVASSPNTAHVPTMIVVSSVLILVLGSVVAFQKQHKNSYVPLRDADEV